MASKPQNRWDDLHGDLVFWIFAGIELITISAGLVIFAMGRAADPEQAQVLHGALHRDLGLINSVILLTSGAFVAVAIARERRRAVAKGFWVAALVVGACFLGTKGYEFGAMFSAGYNLSSGSLITGYFLMTGFHYLHVLLGLVFLGSVAWRRRRPLSGAPEDEEARSFGASAGVFWHSLDLMWVAIFAVVYV